MLGSRAIVHYEAGRVADAVSDLDAAIALAPDLADLYGNRAVALSDLGREEEAAADLRRSVELTDLAGAALPADPAELQGATR